MTKMVGLIFSCLHLQGVVLELNLIITLFSNALKTISTCYPKVTTYSCPCRLMG
jgi:hypothetical protein